MNQKENYWLEQLEKVDGLNLPFLASGNHLKNSKVSIGLSAEQSQIIREIAGNNGFNIFKIVLAALGLTLQRFANQKSILVSIPPLRITRDVNEKDGILYCNLDFYPGQTPSELLKQIHDLLDNGNRNTDYDNDRFTMLYGENNGGDILPLFGAGFEYDKVTGTGNWLNDHALVFKLIETDEKFTLDVNSNQPMFPEAFLRIIGETVVSVIINIRETKSLEISKIPLFSEEKIQRRQKFFESFKRAYDLKRTVIHCLKDVVEEKPDDIAVVFQNTSVSYNTLWMQSEKVMRTLLNADSGNKLAGMLIDPSIEMIVTMIGILRAGFGYVPIDKTHPEQRIREIISEAHLAIVLTDFDFNLNDVLSFNVCEMKEVEKVSFEHHCAPEQIAYVIFSSGTTGHPKGIMIEHQAIMNLMYWYNERYNFNSNTRIIQQTNLIVDMAFQEIFSSFMNGLTLYLPAREERLDKTRLLEFLEKHKINFIQLIPDTLAEYFLDTPRLKYLTTILCGGDKLSESVKDLTIEKGYQLFNIYGQTETSIDVVGAECTISEQMRFSEYVPNCDVWILDDNGQLCPEYVSGEICVGGISLSTGYLGNESLTNERFIAHPVYPDKRIYKTGDIGRLLPDGSIEFVNRLDDQLKIRGYRIETGEIEKLLQKHPDIQEAVVVQYETQVAKELVAYLIGSDELTSSSIREMVQENLPFYMVPSRFVRLEKFPRTVIGKIDKSRLPDPIGIEMKGPKYEPPRNELDEQLIAIWEEILNRPKIGIKDNFFELGGHSLKAVRLVSKVSEHFTVQLDLKELFVESTIEKLSDYISTLRLIAMQSDKTVESGDELIF
jgi:amino acid adenylation domain-containing protein